MRKRRKALRKPMSVGEILDSGLFGKKAGHLLPLYRMQQSWSEIVGKDLAAKTAPVRVQGKQLIVAVENPAWAQHLSMMKTEILHVICERAGKTYADLRFVNEPLSVSRSKKN